MKKQILKDIEKHLNSIDKEILSYGFSITLTVKNDDEEYINDIITINKNFHNGYYASIPRISTYCNQL